MYRISHFPPHIRSLQLVVAVLLLAAALDGCSPSISQFNARAYEQATALKVESLTLMEKATEPYAEHTSAVDALQQELEKAYEFARGRPNNEISAQQWKILIDPERDLLGGFFRNWKENSSLSDAFVREKQRQIGQAFDTIIELESGKRKPDDVEPGS